MPNDSKNKKIKQIPQISDDHCGPAVVQMLLDNLGIETTQENITKAAGVEQTMHKYGTRIDELALAVHIIAPNVLFWYKKDADFVDIVKITKEYNYPVAVEWQGLFEDSLEDEDDETDYGHYSIISYVDEEKKALIVVDPYKDFVNQDRIIPIDLFMERWWDTNKIIDPVTKKKKTVEDMQLLFIIAPKTETFPKEMGLTAFEL